MDHASVQENLNNLSWKILISMGVMFSVLNSSLNQLILYWNQVITSLTDGLCIMLIGDLSGVVLVAALIRLLLLAYKPNTSQLTPIDKD